MDDKQVKFILLFILCFLLPPLTVFLLNGFDVHFVLNILLTIFGFWIFGVVHSVYLLFTKE